MYNMQLSLLADSSDEACASIMHEGDIMTTIYGYNGEQASISAVFICNAGDEVWAEASFATSLQSLSVTGTLYNAFSGFLLYPVWNSQIQVADFV